MPNPGLIPARPMVVSIGRAYGIIMEKMIREIARFDITNYSETEVIKTQKKFEGWINQLDYIAARHSRKFIPFAYNVARRDATTTLRALGRERPLSAGDAVYEEQIDENQKRTLGVYVKANHSILTLLNSFFLLSKQTTDYLNVKLTEFGGIRGVSDKDEIWILNLIDEAVKQGASRQGVSGAISKFMQANMLDGNFIVVNNRRFQMRHYSMMVARTEMRASQSMSTITSCRQYGNDLVEVSDHQTTTEICQEFEGNTYSLDAKTPGYTQLPVAPPFHPNCQHFLIPTSLEIMEFEQEAEREELARQERANA